MRNISNSFEFKLIVPYKALPINLSALQQGTSSVYYYHPNHLSSSMYVTDAQQSVVQSFLYAPYGEIISEYNTHVMGEAFPKYSFNAKELDEETGMYYYEARYYAPPVFTSRDPLFEKYFWMSPYAYCTNNPVKYVDPDGRMMIDAWGDPPKWWKTTVNKWNKLNNKEKNIIRWDIRFYKAKSIEENAYTAIKMTEETYGKQAKGDKGDAFRHALWQALNTQSVGEDFTRKWSEAHEYSTPLNEVTTDLYMDIHNNDIGVEIGIANPNASPNELKDIIVDRISKGNMVIIRNGKLVKSDGSVLKKSEIRQYNTSKKIAIEILNNPDGQKTKDYEK